MINKIRGHLLTADNADDAEELGLISGTYIRRVVCGYTSLLLLI